MNPFSTPFNPYQTFNPPFSNIPGEFPAVLSYNGRIFARRDNSNSPFGSTEPQGQSLRAGQQSHLSQDPQTLPPQPPQSKHPQVQQQPATPNPDRQIPTQTHPQLLHQGHDQTHPQPVSKSATQPQNHPGSIHPPWLSNHMQSNNAYQQNTPRYFQPPFFGTQYLPGSVAIPNPYLPGSQQRPFPLQNPTAHLTTNLASYGLPASEHKCRRCGKPRSARYHYEHPIQPGHTPVKRTCGKCQKKIARDKRKHDGSSDSAGQKGKQHRWSFISRIGRIGRSESQERAFARKRSLSRSSDLEDDSSTISSLDLNRRKVGARRYRAKSSSRNAERSIEAPLRRRRPLHTRTVYVESASEDEDEPHHRPYTRSFSNSSRGRQLPPRTATPVLERIHHQRSCSTTAQSPAAGLRNGYPQRLSDRPTYQHASRSATSSLGAESSSDEVRSFQSNESRPRGRVVGTIHSQEDSEDQYERSVGRAKRVRPYDGGHSAEDDNIVEVHEIISRTPSPATLPRSSQIRHQERSPSPHAGQIRQDIRHGRRPATRDTLAVMVMDSSMDSHRRSRPRKDYDWYDRNGMRVRVREI